MIKIQRIIARKPGPEDVLPLGARVKTKLGPATIYNSIIRGLPVDLRDLTGSITSRTFDEDMGDDFYTVKIDHEIRTRAYLRGELETI
jgi:hypothetical protein